jgi:hypothetical protein
MYLLTLVNLVCGQSQNQDYLRPKMKIQDCFHLQNGFNKLLDTAMQVYSTVPV